MARKHHHLKVFRWINGALEPTSYLFGEEQEAIQFARECGCHSFKLYNPDGELIHSAAHQITQNSYA